MKSFLSSALLAVLLLSTTTACAQNRVVGSKNYITKNIEVKSFKHIKVVGSPDVIYTQSNGKEPKIEVYGSDNIVPLLEINVENTTLVVSFKKNTSITNPGKLEIRVSAPAVESMSVSGSGDIIIPNGISTSGLSLKVSGSGDITGKNITCGNLDLSVTGSGDIELSNAKVQNVNAKVQGSGDIELSGTAMNANYQVTGSGDITAHKLKADHVQAGVSGSGDITCHAVETLKGKVSGSGDVGYKGDPDISFSKRGLHKL